MGNRARETQNVQKRQACQNSPGSASWRRRIRSITSATQLFSCDIFGPPVVGCGSGILGMIALKFGAAFSMGTDLDPCAIEATHENMEVNGIPKDRYEVMTGNIIDDKTVQDRAGYGCYDIVVANILADVLVELTPVIKDQLKEGGIYITSGIIDDKEQTVVDGVKAAGMTILDVTYQGEWVCVTARK